MGSCGGCQETWTALGTAHCAGCHRTFAAVRLFDKHRHQRGEHGGCLDPAGLREFEYRDGMWRGPEMGQEVRASFSWR